MADKLRQAHEPLVPVDVMQASRFDLLGQIMTAQEDIMRLYDAKRPQLHAGRPLSLKLTTMAEAIQMEASEMKAWLPWKRWRNEYGRALTEEECEGVIEELVDMLHFIFESFILLGITDPEEIAGYYLAKNKVNRERQEQDY